MTTVFDRLGANLAHLHGHRFFVDADNPDVVASKSNYGFLAFLVFFCLAIAVWIISRSLNKHLRKIRFAEREEELAREAAEGTPNSSTTA